MRLRPRVESRLQLHQRLNGRVLWIHKSRVDAALRSRTDTKASQMNAWPTAVARPLTFRRPTVGEADDDVFGMKLPPPGLCAPLWPRAQKVGDLNARDPHHVEHQQSKAEAVKASIELVDEGLLGNTHVVRLETAAQVFVRQVFVPAQIEHQLLGVNEVNLLVCRTQRHQRRQIVCELTASYWRFILDALNNSFTRYSVDTWLKNRRSH